MRRLLFWTAAVFILLSAALVAVSLAHLHAQALQAGERLTQSMAQVIEEQTSRTLQTVDQQLQLAGVRLAQAGGVPGREQARSLLQAQLSALPFLRGLWVLDMQGRIVFDTDTSRIGTDRSDQPYFQVHLQAPQTGFYIGSPMRGISTGAWLLAASRPLVASDGRLAGVIVAALDPRYFETLWGTVDLDTGGSVAMMRRSGEMMVRSPFDAAVVGRNFKDQPLFSTYLVQAPSGSFRHESPIDGQERAYAYRTLSLLPDLLVVVGQSRVKMLAPWRHLAWLALLIWAASSLAVTLLCAGLHRAWRRGREADAALNAAAQRLTLATEVAAIAVWDWDVQIDRWYASPTYFTMLGYDPAEGQDRRDLWLERVHPEDRAGVAARIRAIMTDPDTPYQYEARMRHADGRYRWIEVIGRVLSRDTEGKVARLLGVRIDITERKQAEEERLRVFERITDAFVALDSHFRYTHVNRLAGQLLRREPERLIGRHIWTEFPEMVAHPLRTAMESALARQVPVTSELYFEPLGRWFENRIHPSADGLTVYFHDITARRATEESLRLSEENLSITLQSIGDAVIATDTGGAITRMNATAERLTGWRLAEAAGQPLDAVFHIIHAQTREPVPNPAQLVLAHGEVVGLANHTALLSRDGTEYQIADSGAPIRDAEGQVVGVVLVFSDVTESYRVREALATTVGLLERTGELAKVGGWDFDLRTQRVFWTRETCRIHDIDAGLTPPVEQALDFYPPLAREAVLAALQAGIDHATPWDLEVPLITAKGRHIWVRTQGFAVLEDGKVTRLSGALHDITDRRQAEDDLRAASLRTQTILDNMTDGVVTIDACGRIESFNRAASRMFGYTAEEVLGRDVTMLMSTHDRGRHDSFLEPHLDAQPFEIADTPRELEGLRKNGMVFPMSLSVSRNRESGQVSFIGVLRDITRQRDDMEEIRRLAFFDLLTALPNRRLLMDRLRQAMSTSARTGQHGALMLLDLDHFKMLNDSAGHDVGDVLLQQVALRLQACVRECDSVARLGGDEFVVLLEALSPQDHEAATQTEIVANKILDAFKTSFVLRDQRHDSTTSIGIVVFRGDGERMDDLLKKADVAMYQAKSAGRNGARFFDPAMQAAVTAHEALEKDLRRGLAMQEFVLHYQVQVDGKGRAIGAEALIRWNHPERGLVAPGHFIPLAEETGLILPMGQWVLETACRQLVAWAADPATASWTMAVNVSAPQFAQADFVAHVAEALHKAGADPRLLKLELTESMLVGDMEDVVRKMNRLKSQGVGFSLDDFGTGYSSLSYLKRLPLDQLKIDQSFVRDVLSDASDAVIARTIVALGQSLGLMVIAEGVETAEQHDFLTQIACDGFQGYFFGRPVPAPALLAPAQV